jgi:hypothetical protein
MLVTLKQLEANLDDMLIKLKKYIANQIATVRETDASNVYAIAKKTE